MQNDPVVLFLSLLASSCHFSVQVSHKQNMSGAACCNPDGTIQNWYNFNVKDTLAFI